MFSYKIIFRTNYMQHIHIKFTKNLSFVMGDKLLKLCYRGEELGCEEGKGKFSFLFAFKFYFKR
jgi:hypothetical protein